MSTTLPQRFSLDQHQRGGAAAIATWAQIEADLPAVAATMRAYLDPIAVVLHPGSVDKADLCLRSFCTYLPGPPTRLRRGRTRWKRPTDASRNIRRTGNVILVTLPSCCDAALPPCVSGLHLYLIFAVS